MRKYVCLSKINRWNSSRSHIISYIYTTHIYIVICMYVYYRYNKDVDLNMEQELNDNNNHKFQINSIKCWFYQQLSIQGKEYVNERVWNAIWIEIECERSTIWWIMPLNKTVVKATTRNGTVVEWNVRKETESGRISERQTIKLLE